MEKLLKILLVIFVIAGNIVVIMATSAGIIELYISVGIVGLSLFFLVSLYLDTRKKSRFNSESRIDEYDDEDFEEDVVIATYYKQQIEHPEDEELAKTERILKEKIIESNKKINFKEVVASSQQETDDISEIKSEDFTVDEISEIKTSETTIVDSLIQEEEMSENKIPSYFVGNFDNQPLIKPPQKNLLDLKEKSLDLNLDKRRCFKRKVSKDKVVSYHQIDKEKAKTEARRTEPDADIKEKSNKKLIELNYETKKNIQFRNIGEELKDFRLKSNEVKNSKDLKGKREAVVGEEFLANQKNLGSLLKELIAAFSGELYLNQDLGMSDLFSSQMVSDYEFNTEMVDFVIQDQYNLPLVGVQIYNHLGRLKDRIFVAAVFKNANLPLIAFHENMEYKRSEIKELLEELLEES